MGHTVSASTIPTLLERLDYRRHVNRKTKDGGQHPDRDAQFEYINAKALGCQAAGQHLECGSKCRSRSIT
jgi:hypothetical protein